MVNPPNQPNKKTNTVVETYNKIALKFFMDGLSISIQESVKDYTSAKDLRLKLEEEYLKKSQDQKIKQKSRMKSKKKSRYKLQTQVKVSTLKWMITLKVMMMKLFLQKMKKIC